MNEWFQRQFGDRAEVAIVVSLGVDPHPIGERARDLSWGSLELWANGTCLTENVLDGSVAAGVRWSLLPVLEWLLDVGIRLVNEDPYPRFSKGRDVGDGTAWYDATLQPPVLSEEAERRWFLRRSEWRHHHALRRSTEDAALPNVVFRRLGDDVEISWDNESWAAARSNLRFVERRGRALTPARRFGRVIRETVVEVLSALVSRTEEPAYVALSARAASFAADRCSWRWLVHRPTAELIRSEMPALCRSLDEATASGLEGVFVPHTSETRILRHLRLDTKQDVEAVLHAATRLPTEPVAGSLKSLIRPLPASNSRPWDEGNEFADGVREALGWGTEPLPELAGWMSAHGIAVPEGDLGLPASVDVFAERTEDARAMVHVNPRGSTLRKETGLATALGHVLLDEGVVSIDGDWEHWPTSARARAFAVALTLPEDGVREMLNETASIGVAEVRQVMLRFRSGVFATTFRLKNLGLITRDEATELQQKLF